MSDIEIKLNCVKLSLNLKPYKFLLFSKTDRVMTTGYVLLFFAFFRGYSITNLLDHQKSFSVMDDPCLETKI